MKKMTLIAASVALALTGCADDDNKPAQPTQPSTTQITAFDGYFHNAVVFNDTNENGVLDINADTIFGLTDIKGQISIPTGQTGFLALQTLTIGGPVQTALALFNSAKYANIYTVDSDHPDQPVSNELVLRSPATADVISPITDLVAIEMNGGATEQDAIEKVNENLGLGDSSTVTVYSDFVEEAATNDEAAELHKTAQILTVTKAADPINYEQKSDKIAKEAKKTVEEMPADDVRNPDKKPIVDGDPNTAPIENSPLVINKDVSDSITSILAEVPYQVGNQLALELNIDGLFTDADQSGAIAISLTQRSLNSFAEMGITAKISADFKSLTLTANALTKAGTVEIIVEAQDFDSATPTKAVGNPTSLAYLFKVVTPAPNEQPSPNADALANLNAEAQNWAIKEGVQFSQTLDITSLFTDPESDSLTYDASVRNDIGLAAVVAEGVVTVSGIPTNIVADRKEAFYIYTWDGQHGTGDGNAIKVEVKLPAIELAPVVPTPDNDLVGKDLFFVEVETQSGRYYPDGLAYCSILNLEGGVAYIRDGQDYEHKKECPAMADKVVLGDYSIADDGTVTIHETSDGKQYEISMKIADSFNVDKSVQYLTDAVYRVETLDVEVGSDGVGSKGAMEIFTNINDVDYFIYSNSPCTDKDPMCQGRYSKHIMPSLNNEPGTEKPLDFVLGTVGYSLLKEADGTFDADINFDLAMDNKVMTCDTLTSIYGGAFFFTIQNADGTTDSHITVPDDCYENDEGASIDFDLNVTIADDSTVSFAALPNMDYKAKLPRLAVNMEWTGEGNND